MEKVIAISTDQNYTKPVEALIKSIAYNNRDIKIYIINEDLPQEWFINLNQRLASINIRVIDLKLDPALLNDEQVTIDYLSKMTYARILVPDLIPEDRVLYLDADTIVDKNLDELFNLDLQGNAIAAVKDYFGDFFNAGVLLIDNKKLRGTSFVHDMLEQGKQAPADNDQTLLNNKFGRSYFELPGMYNVQVGGDLVTFWQRDDLEAYKQVLKRSEPYAIIHYTTNSKPWMTTNSLQLRDKWWQYYLLEYGEVTSRAALPVIKTSNRQATLFTFTNDENIKYLDRLAQALPNYEFNIAAYILMGSKLIKMLKYPNVKLHPSMTPLAAEHFLRTTDGYLDINYGSKDEGIIESYLQKKIPVITFEEVATPKFRNADNYTVFADDDLAAAITAIKNLK